MDIIFQSYINWFVIDWNWRRLHDITVPEYAFVILFHFQFLIHPTPQQRLNQSHCINCEIFQEPNLHFEV